MTDIETLIIEEANKRDLTYAEDFNGRAYALMDVDWIAYFDTINEVIEYLGISSEEISKGEKVEASKLQQAYNKGFGDCRQAMLDTISELNAISFYEAQEDSKECYYEIRQAVENMSPITPKPKTKQDEYDDAKYHEEHGEVVVEKDLWEDAKRALEQGSVLNKIKTEIDLDTRIQVKHYTNTDAVIDAVLDVIDKYKTEEE